jgi:hypothetical protein
MADPAHFANPANFAPGLVSIGANPAAIKPLETRTRLPIFSLPLPVVFILLIGIIIAKLYTYFTSF